MGGGEGGEGGGRMLSCYHSTPLHVIPLSDPWILNLERRRRWKEEETEMDY